MSNAELIARLRHQHLPDNPWEKCDLRDVMEAAATALEAADGKHDDVDPEEFCSICFAGTKSSEHLAQAHGECDR